MSQMAVMVLADGQTTPANHNFNPLDREDGIAKWVDRTSGVALGYPQVTLSTKKPTKTSRNFRVTFKVVTPVLEQTSASTATGIQPAPTKAYDLIFNGEFVLPERSSRAQRQDILAFTKNFLANTAYLGAAVLDNESIY